ncbi:MAG: RNA-binding transcriptional accessory protein [Clostridium sp.]|nr:RNA-binding transcriptional accessory protein [Clostridium sp.]
MTDFSRMIATRLSLHTKGVSNTLKLLSEGATVPFISRYRKEATGSMDEVAIAAIKDAADELTELEKRKETILSTIRKSERLTPELEKRIADCWNGVELEDIYLPFKPKRKTRAEIARQHGLEPLANLLLMQREPHPEHKAQAYVNKEVPTAEDVLKGACDILAEHFNENEQARNIVRRQFERTATITSRVCKGKEEEAAKYRDYFDFSEPLKRCSSHRLLAMRRGEAEGFLRITISPDEEECLMQMERRFLHPRSTCKTWIGYALTDAFKRLLKPSIETEFATLSKQKADEEAIRVFTENLRQLLLAAPLGQKRTLAIDPGFRTGCKVVCLDAQGTLLHNETIFPHPPHGKTEQAGRKIQQLTEQYQIEAIAIGNGTASRETENFIRAVRFPHPVEVYIVNEDGASIYSASSLAREEFPDYDVTVRGAVSIGRRLMDPLAELVKIDPKSIGIGQYQHDVDGGKLKKALDQTVESCVNTVGVNLNTASYHLLAYISGLGPQLARNIVQYRTENGPFRNRRQLLKVARMGERTFEMCAGFLRIPQGENPLDNSSVHPERYEVVKAMANDLHSTVEELIKSKELRQKIKLEQYVSDTCGMPTLTDIMHELDKPGRDPRSSVKPFAFADNVRKIDDLTEGMTLPGIVTNITNFGCFVDIGIHEKGLVHISQMADHYVSDPTGIVSLNQHVTVRVIEIDKQRKRIALSLKKA